LQIRNTQQIFICSTSEIFRLIPTFREPILAGFVREKLLAANKTRKIIENIDTAIKYSNLKLRTELINYITSEVEN